VCPLAGEVIPDIIIFRIILKLRGRLEALLTAARAETRCRLKVLLRYALSA
jgi:hypothetical protein